MKIIRLFVLSMLCICVALSCKSPISSTSSSTYSVTYYGNENTSGTVPTDNQNYKEGATVIVLGNTGNLVKTGYTFSGWNTTAEGTGTSYASGTGFTIESANLSLYAMWTLGYSVTFDWGSYQNLIFSSTNLTMTKGSTLTLTSIFSDGTNWQWFVNNVQDTTQTSENFSFIPSMPGYYVISVNVKNNGVFYSGTVSVSVNQ
jgi:uncharacterized repeat protein (TIGR02543 family)